MALGLCKGGEGGICADRRTRSSYVIGFEIEILESFVDYKLTIILL